jgi:nitroreductase
MYVMDFRKTNVMVFKELKKLLQSDRSVRRFDASRSVNEDTMRSLVELTRYCASGRNAQPLRYRIVTTGEERDALFPLLAWAGYYTEWQGPDESQRPTAYLVQCRDTALGGDGLCDDGIQLQAITLGAAALGLGCCIIKAFNPGKVKETLNIPEALNPLYVVAIGYPAERTKIVDMPSDGNFKYYRDTDDTQCVPKRPLEELIIK